LRGERGNSDTKAHQHGKAGLITVWWKNGSGAGSVVVCQRATTLSIYSTINPPWSGTGNDNPELTALSCIGSGIAGWTRIIQTINGSVTKQAA